MHRVAQVIQYRVPNRVGGLNRKFLDLEFRNRMMEESFVAEVLLEGGKTESGGRDLTNLQGVLEVRNQILSGKGQPLRGMWSRT